MALLVSDIDSYLQHRLGGKGSMSTVMLCNQAGHHLTSMHAWEWLKRPPVALALVAGQEWAKLPADFGRAIVNQGALISGGFKWATFEYVISLRSQSVQVTGPWWYVGALVHRPSIVGGALEPRVEVYPTPTASDNTTYKCAYYAAWTDLRDDRVTIPIPSQFELLYLEIVFALAQGYEDHDVAGISARVTALKGSSLFTDAMAFDGGRISNLGQMRGGWYPSSSGVDWSLYPASISRPGV